MSATLLIRHGRAWRSDPVYRLLWLLAPLLAAALFAVWIFEDPSIPAGMGNNGIWWSDTDPRFHNLALLSSQAATNPAAEAELRKRASGGDSNAQFYLGYFLDPQVNPQLGTVERTRESMKWYKTAADAGIVGAAANYGLLKAHRQGFSIPPDYAEALKYLQMAGNNPVALRELAILYYEGNGVAPDQKRANALMQQAADAGDRGAPYYLGEDYDKGYHGHAVDKSLAVFYFRQSALAGLPDAQRELGLHLYSGDGVEKNTEQAVFWLKNAAGNEDQVAHQFLNDNKLN